MKHYDLAIVGGGMVGLALACSLKNSALSIAIIDAAPLTPSLDPRLIALNHTSYSLFKNIDLWGALAPHATAIHQVHVSTQGKFGSTILNANEINLPQLGYLVPAQHINTALQDRVASLQNIDSYRPAKLIGIDQEPDQVIVKMSHAEHVHITASIVIAADGTHSTVRELAGIATEEFDYAQQAIVTITELQRDHHHIAYERFLPTGAIAMLPLTGQRAATIWSDKTNTISELMQYSDTEFLEKLRSHFGYRLGRLLAIQKRFVYPLKFIRAKETIKQRVILIGNAAHTLHPVAAQGLNTALYEIAELVEKIQAFGLKNTHELAPQQWAGNKIKLSHSLAQLFTTDFFIVNSARQAGMIALDVCSSAKREFIQRIMGTKGRIPALLQEELTP